MNRQCPHTTFQFYELGVYLMLFYLIKIEKAMLQEHDFRKLVEAAGTIVNSPRRNYLLLCLLQ